jgi:hypothetical protein
LQKGPDSGLVSAGHTEKAIRTIEGHLDALTLIVEQLLGELPELQRKFLSQRAQSGVPKGIGLGFYLPIRCTEWFGSKHL